MQVRDNLIHSVGPINPTAAGHTLVENRRTRRRPLNPPAPASDEWDEGSFPGSALFFLDSNGGPSISSLQLPGQPAAGRWLEIDLRKSTRLDRENGFVMPDNVSILLSSESSKSRTACSVFYTFCGEGKSRGLC